MIGMHSSQKAASGLTAALRAVGLILCLAVGLTAAPGAGANSRNASSQTDASPAAIVDSMPRLGVDSGDVMDTPALNNASASGARVARLSVLWSTIEPSDTDPSAYTWSATDSRLNSIAAHGLMPLVLVDGCPTWACVRDSDHLNDDRRPDAAEFFGALAARYSHAPYNVHFWEIWNEPDAAGGPGNQWGWGMHPDKYALMLALALQQP